MMRWLGFLLLAAAFGVSYGQYPLFYLAQNEYFYYGLMRAGFGLLRDDWLAVTADPWPAFTVLVEFTYRWLGLHVIYLYYLVLLGVYAYSMLGIASLLFGINRSKSRYLATVAAMTLVHSPAIALLSREQLGFDVSRTLIEGVASQRILWDMLQPGAFGVFLLLSILLFLRGRPFLAVASAAVAATVQPIYLLGAGVLTLSYMVVTVRRGQGLGRAVGLGLCALIMVLPVLIHTFLVFRPTALDAWTGAQQVLVIRLARHAEIARWFNKLVYVKLAVILLGLYVVRRTELFWIMFLSFFVALVLTVVQALSGSDTLATIYPWRLSVYLVPLTTVILIAYSLGWVLDRLGGRHPSTGRAVAALSLVVLVALVGAGATMTSRRFATKVRVGSAELMEFVRAKKSPGETYLVPQNWREFRLFTGAPTFVDFWFVPYNDVAVLEWYKRLGLAKTFYETRGSARCAMLRELATTYGVTHVVLRRGGTAPCGGTTRVFGDGDFELHRIGRGEGGNRRTLGEGS